MAKNTLCNTCSQSNDRGSDGWIECEFCLNWYHGKCVGFKVSAKSINWHCDNCKGEFLKNKKQVIDLQRLLKECEFEKDLYKKQLDDLNKSIGLNVEKIGTKIDELNEVVRNGPPAADARVSYADTLKAKKKRQSKNLLIVESTDSSQELDEAKKDELVGALGTTQVIDMRGKERKITMNFDNEEIRNEAVQKIADIPGIKVRPVKKLYPKIKVLKVQGVEKSETIIEDIIDRNRCLDNIENVKEKIWFIFRKSSNYIGYFDYLLKCDPEVRRAVHSNGDKICLRFGRYDIVDSYHVTICYHCQQHGHIAKDCPAKDKICPNCAENHGIKECNVQLNCRKCFTCTEAKQDDRNKSNDWIKAIDACHRANTSSCPLFVAVIQRIKDNTNHGF